MARSTTRSRAANTTFPALKFDQKLVLFQWMLGLFGAGNLEQLAREIKSPDYEGFDVEGITQYYHILTAQLFERDELPNDLLLRYDQNIVRHWKTITERRNQAGPPKYPKYFQYLSLLFTEVYLDRYFRNPEKLLSDLNRKVEDFNFKTAGAGAPVEPYVAEDLNKIAFWSATGSGKTLLMHVNIHQYKHYLKEFGRERDLNRIILLTPNEGLSMQHLEEFELSGMQAEPFSKEGRSLFAGHAITVIEVSKLREATGQKTIAVDAFEDNNLVLVDEGHRGSSSEEGLWMRMRSQLCEKGFSFEYSATFGQAIKASNDKNLEQQYLKCILFDYSYRYFYSDGYGKDFKILNLEKDDDEEVRRKYLTACLLTFYQQQKLYNNRRTDLAPFLIDRPLWVFVGGKVTAVRKERGKDVSDVVDVLLFLSSFVNKKRDSVRYITELLKGRSGLRDHKDRDLFSASFKYLILLDLTAEQVYEDILQTLFNAPAPALLHVENLKGTDGEIALRLGDNETFGVINVGDANALCALCEKHVDHLVVETRDFAESLFHRLDDTQSTINVLIGSKKFTEGWNSWRVSTMGLMNIARSEGPQIIQLFGRGVRLKGYEYCLKRSKFVFRGQAPEFIEQLETLNIFGIRADYMRQFREYLEEEGLPSEDQRVEIVLPVIKNLGEVKLKTIKLKDGVDFKKQGERPLLGLPDEYLKKNPVVLDWYPQIQALASKKSLDQGDVVVPNRGILSGKHVSFLDVDQLFFDLEQFKYEKAYFNLKLSREQIRQLLLHPEWYVLYIPQDELEYRDFKQVRRWQEIAKVLLIKYCERFYKAAKAAFENDKLEYRDLTPDDPNFIDEYRFYVEQSATDIVAKLTELAEAFGSGQLKELDFRGLIALNFNNHLYQPIVYVKNDHVEVKPVVLESPGEKDFVTDLKTFCESRPALLEGKELYLLRNLSRGRGIGFFEAGNFHPDFILWIVVGDRQFVSFVDPKGLHHVDGLNDPKIRFCETIKTLEQRLANPNVILNSFIVSSTPYEQIAWWIEHPTKDAFAASHVLFQFNDRDTYIRQLVQKSLALST
jgi:superfamily II DNA or RNA helicase